LISPIDNYQHPCYTDSMTKHNCIICKKEFARRGEKSKTAKFCSLKCKGVSQIGNTPNWLKTYIKKSKKPENYLACEECGKEFYVSPTKRGNRKFCSRQCHKKNGHMGENVSGAKHWNWKGGRSLVGGYVYILKKDHPFANKAGRVMEHRLVMEKYLGRYLNSNEEVHHADQDKENNNINNLSIMIKKAHYGKVKCPHCEKSFSLK